MRIGLQVLEIGLRSIHSEFEWRFLRECVRGVIVARFLQERGYSARDLRLLGAVRKLDKTDAGTSELLADESRLGPKAMDSQMPGPVVAKRTYPGLFP